MDLTQINIFNVTKGLIDRDSSLRCFEKYYKNLPRLMFSECLVDYTEQQNAAFFSLIKRI